MRSRGVSVSASSCRIWRSSKALFEKQWESIVGNCDDISVFGRQRAEHPQVCVELLGKETIDTNTYGKSYRTKRELFNQLSDIRA
ncbi:MAG: TraM recognition domain-containing protein [Blautia faecis]